MVTGIMQTIYPDKGSWIWAVLLGDCAFCRTLKASLYTVRNKPFNNRRVERCKRLMLMYSTIIRREK